MWKCILNMKLLCLGFFFGHPTFSHIWSEKNVIFSLDPYLEIHWTLLGLLWQITCQWYNAPQVEHSRWLRFKIYKFWVSVASALHSPVHRDRPWYWENEVLQIGFWRQKPLVPIRGHPSITLVAPKKGFKCPK